MLENIGLKLNNDEYIELINILDFTGETIDSFIDLCYQILESPSGSIYGYFGNVYARFRSPQQIYNALIESHTFIPRNCLKDYMQEYFTNWYIDDIDDIKDVKMYFDFMLDDIHDSKDGFIKTSYC